MLPNYPTSGSPQSGFERSEAAERADISRQAGGAESPVPSEWPEARTTDTSPALSDPPDLQARLHALVSEMRRVGKQQNTDLTSAPLFDIALEELVPKLAARVEKLEADLLNLEGVFAMCADVALSAHEKADSGCDCCKRLDEIAELETGEAA